MYDKPVFDPEKRLKQVAIDAVKLYFWPLRDPKQRRVVLLVALIGGLLGLVEFWARTLPV